MRNRLIGLDGTIRLKSPEADGVSRPCLLTPRRGLAVAVMVRLMCHWHEERGNC